MSSNESYSGLPAGSRQAIEVGLLAVRAERERRNRDRLLADDCERCRSLSGFIRAAWHVLEPSTPYVHGWCIDAVAEHLEAVSRGQITRLVINIVPGAGKSNIASVMFPAWEWGPGGRPNLRYLASSFSETNVLRDNLKMRRLVESDWYKERWSHVQLSSDQNAKSKFENTALGFREGRPLPSLTGGRADRLILDDVASTESAESEAERATVARIFRESVPLRINDPQKSAIIVIMQRLHSDDVCGQIEQLGLPYEKLVLPMRFEGARRCSTSIGFVDPRQVEGELLFPERFPLDVVERDEKVLGPYGVATQFQQRPSPRGGGLFKRAWFEVVDGAPEGTMWVRGWDLAATEGAGAYTAGVKLGRDKKGVYYIGDVRRARLSPAGVERLIAATAEMDGTSVPIDLPQDPGQAGKSQRLYLTSRLAGYRVHSTAETGSKLQRAEPVASQAEVGNVKLVRGAWNEPFLQEAETFPNGSYKDQIDGLSRAFARLVVLSRWDDGPPCIVGPKILRGDGWR